MQAYQLKRSRELISKLFLRLSIGVDRSIYKWQESWFEPRHKPFQLNSQWNLRQILFASIIQFSPYHPTLNLRSFPCRLPCFSMLPGRQKYTIFSFSFYLASTGNSLCLLFFAFFFSFFSVHSFFNLCHLAELFGKAFPLFFQEIHPKISMVANDHLKIFLVHSSFHFLFQRRKFY